jgi:hypothetical protein
MTAKTRHAQDVPMSSLSTLFMSTDAGSQVAKLEVLFNKLASEAVCCLKAHGIGTALGGAKFITAIDRNLLLLKLWMLNKPT